MNWQYFCGATILTALLFAPTSKAQAASLDSNAKTAALTVEGKEAALKAVIPGTTRKSQIFVGKEKSPVHFNKKRFLFLSAAVYGASLADMHQTLRVRHYDWWSETDPLARPLVKLPAPAYYATGLAMATGINWVSWKMEHSRRWHKLAAIPQLFAIGGNTYGFKSNRYSSYY